MSSCLTDAVQHPRNRISQSDATEEVHMKKDVSRSYQPISSSKLRCSICDDRSSGFHYGTNACEGCKGFFRRMVTSQTAQESELQCSGTMKNMCSITMETRSKCQRCRLHKCFVVGMTRHKTRLGRRRRIQNHHPLKGIAHSSTSSSGNQQEHEQSHKQPVVKEVHLSDAQMIQMIENEYRLFSNVNLDSSGASFGGALSMTPSSSSIVVTRLADDEGPPSLGCIKMKAKMYSEQNSRQYPKFSPESNNPDEDLYRLSNLSSSTNSVHPSSLSGCSTSEVYESPNYSDNTKTRCFKQISAWSKSVQLHDFCGRLLELLVWIAEYGNCDSGTQSEVVHTLRVSVSAVYDMMPCLQNPTIDDMDEFYRLHVGNISLITHPMEAFSKLIPEMIDVCRRILDLFQNLPGVKLTPPSRRSALSVLLLWSVRLVNLSENVLYSPRLTAKIPLAVLTSPSATDQHCSNIESGQRTSVPLYYVFELLVELARSAETVLDTDVLDDVETAFAAALIVTYPLPAADSNQTAPLLQNDQYYKWRYLYSAGLFDYILKEKLMNNEFCSETRLEKIYWLISKSIEIDETSVNYFFENKFIV